MKFLLVLIVFAFSGKLLANCEVALKTPHKISILEYIKATKTSDVYDFIERTAKENDGIFQVIIPTWLRRTVSGLSYLPNAVGGDKFKQLNQSFNLFPKGMYFPLKIGMAQDILKNSKSTTRVYEDLAHTLGAKSLFVKNNNAIDEDQQWKLAHQTMATYFSKKVIHDEYKKDLVRMAEELASEIKKNMNGSSSVWENVTNLVNHYSARVLAKVLFAYDFTYEQSVEYRPIFDDVFKASKSGDPDRIEFVRNSLLKLANTIIDSSDRKPDSLLNALVKTAEENSLPITWVQDQIITLIYAGQETTRSLLTMSLYKLSEHKEIQNLLRMEHSIQEPYYNLIKDFKYTNAFINEVLRLYPPVPNISRIASEDIIVGDYTIPKGAVIYISIKSMHRLDWGDDAQDFKPSRFYEHYYGNGNSSTHEKGFCPFGYGMRMCIGHLLARAETVTFIGAILNQLVLKVDPDHKPKLGYKNGTLTIDDDFKLLIQNSQ